MNEHSPTASAAASPSAVSESAKPNVLRIVLFAILAVMVVALIYEYGSVRPSYKAAETTIDDLMEVRSVSSEEPVTPQVVQARFGKAPVGGMQDKGHYHVEHYRWVRGLPWQSYHIYVVYAASDPPVLFNSTRPNPPGPNDVPAPPIALSAATASGEAPSAQPQRGPGSHGQDASPESQATPDEPAEATSQEPVSPGDEAQETPAPPSEPTADAAPAAPDATEGENSQLDDENESGQ